MKDLVKTAVDLAGGQTALATRIGKSKQLVQKLCAGERNVSAEVAIAIHDATGGVVAKHALRPDLFSDSEPSTEAPGAAA